MLSLIREAYHKRLSNAVAAGTSAVNSSSIDMSGFDAVLFKVAWGTITSTAVTSIKIQGSSDDSTFVDLEGTSQSVADTDDNLVTLAEVLRPTYRYLRVVVTRGTANAVIDSIDAIAHSPRFTPVTQGATVQGTPEIAVSPPTGTA